MNTIFGERSSGSATLSGGTTGTTSSSNSSGSNTSSGETIGTGTTGTGTTGTGATTSGSSSVNIGGNGSNTSLSWGVVVIEGGDDDYYILQENGTDIAYVGRNTGNIKPLTDKYTEEEIKKLVSQAPAIGGSSGGGSSSGGGGSSGGGTSSGGETDSSGISGGNYADSIISACQQLTQAFLNRPGAHYSVGSDLISGDIDRCINEGTAICCATYVAMVLRVAGILPAEYINQFNYHWTGSGGIPDMCDNATLPDGTKIFQRIDPSQAQPGDIVNDYTIHAMIYWGNGTVWDQDTCVGSRSNAPRTRSISGCQVWRAVAAGGTVLNVAGGGGTAASGGTYICKDTSTGESWITTKPPAGAGISTGGALGGTTSYSGSGYRPEVSGGAEGWRDIIKQAFQETGYTWTQDKEDRIVRQIQTESGGDQYAIQGVTEAYFVDANTGTPITVYGGTCPFCPNPNGASCGNTNIAHGLLQFIPELWYDCWESKIMFKSSKTYTDIWSGFDQICTMILMCENSLYNKDYHYLGNGIGYSPNTWYGW